MLRSQSGPHAAAWLSAVPDEAGAALLRPYAHSTAAAAAFAVPCCSTHADAVHRDTDAVTTLTPTVTITPHAPGQDCATLLGEALRCDVALVSALTREGRPCGSPLLPHMMEPRSPWPLRVPRLVAQRAPATKPGWPRRWWGLLSVALQFKLCYHGLISCWCNMTGLLVCRSCIHAWTYLWHRITSL